MVRSVKGCDGGERSLSHGVVLAAGSSSAGSDGKRCWAEDQQSVSCRGAINHKVLSVKSEIGLFSDHLKEIKRSFTTMSGFNFFKLVLLETF